jgi:ABC-type branched-subunit amino acid transport system ATPase component
MTPLLEVVDVHKHFGGVAALSGCSLSLRRGEVTGLIGPNGAGKTTLLNIISGLIKPDSGTVRFDGHDVVALPMHRVAELGLVRTFQIIRELSGLTVLESLLVAAAGQRGEAVGAALFARGAVRTQEQRHAEQARRILKRIGLWKQADQSTSALSGGQKKLLEFGRILMRRPKLVLLDEPAAGVAPPLLDDITALIRELKADGIAFGIVEHDMHLIGAICDRVHVMAEGRTLLSGGFAEVTADARVVEAYLGLAL